MKLLLTGLIALSMVAYSRADGFGSGIGFGIGVALANKVLSGGQSRQRVVEHEHRTVVHERTVVVHEKAAPAPSPAGTTVIVNNNPPAQPVAQPTSATTLNAKTITVTNAPTQVTAPAPTVTSPAAGQKNLADDTNVN